MKLVSCSLLALVAAVPAWAEGQREIGAHAHGVSTLELALENGVLEMDLSSPGMDIVGFEYVARTQADRTAIDEALRLMQSPGAIVSLPDAAACRLTSADAQLMAAAADQDADTDHAEDHSHHDHAEDDAHGHEDAAAHSAFQMRFAFACDRPQALDKVSFPFFETFARAQQIEVFFVTEAGAGSAQIRGNAPTLLLRP